MTKNTMKQSKTDYPKDELSVSNAMQRGEYLLESASLPVILMGEIAERLKRNKPINDIQAVEFGIKKSSLSKYALSTLKMMIGKDWQKTEHEGVTIIFRVIKQDKGFLKRPDQASFWGGIYKVPNPFNKYWRMRGLVR